MKFPEPKFTPEKIAYYSFGESEKKLLLVHGSFGSAMMWQMYIKPLVKAGYEVIALDLQGHGRSREFDLARTTMSDYLANIESVIKIINRGPIILIGHSMAGLLVLMAAAKELSNKVVSIDPSPSRELQGEAPSENIPKTYSAMDAGMPMDPESMMKAMPDIDPMLFEKIGTILGLESGTARKERKIGISIARENLAEIDVLFLGAELGDSLKFGISAESTKKMAEYYGKPYFEIKGASHPGMLLGKSATPAIQRILEWLK